MVNYGAHMYADDVLLYKYTRIENIDFCIDLINYDFRKIDNWVKANELCVDPSKPKCLLLSRQIELSG